MDKLADVANTDMARAIAPERLRTLRRSEYDWMVAAGLFGDERIELLRGVLVEMSPQEPAHAGAVDNLADRLRAGLRGRARVRTHSPLAVAVDSEPEPDVAVVPPGDYRRSHPTTALLVVEIASSSLRKDRGVKLPAYSQAGIPEDSIVNLIEPVLEVYTDVADNRYRRSARFRPGDTVHSEALPDIDIPVAELPPERGRRRTARAVYTARAGGVNSTR